MASLPAYAAASPPGPTPGEPRDSFPRWPLWGPFVAIALGLAFSILLVGVVSAVVESAGGKVDSGDPWFTVLTTLGVALCVVVASVAIAGMKARPAPWQFGLRRAPLGFSAGVAFMAAVAVVLFTIVYSSIVDTENKQRI